jgi:hypothetical protein
MSAALIEQLKSARVYDLEQPRFAGMPIHETHRPGYFYGLHRRHRDTYNPSAHGPRSGASGVLHMMEHSGTHIEMWLTLLYDSDRILLGTPRPGGFCHVRPYRRLFVRPLFHPRADQG